MSKEKQFQKFSDREIKVIEPGPTKETIISYDRILNDIAELETKLANLYALKAEADKLKLKR